MAYHEREAAMAWGYRMSEWETETVNRRAQCVAHYFHRLMRESFASEHAMKKTDKKSGGQSYDSLMKAMGLPH